MASPDSENGQTPDLQQISQAQGQEPDSLQTPMIPTPAPALESRHPLSRFESAAQEPEDLLASSFQSTDTVRRRPEDNIAGYGMLYYASQVSEHD